MSNTAKTARASMSQPSQFCDAKYVDGGWFLTTEWNIDDEIAVKVRSAREEERENLARDLLADGLDVDYVARKTKLDLATVILLQSKGY